MAEMAMAAKPDPVNVKLSSFVVDKYRVLKTQAEADNTTLPNSDVTEVIKLIDALYEVFISKATDEDEKKIIGHLNNIHTKYTSLNLKKEDYPNYTDAMNSITTIVDGLKLEDLKGLTAPT